MCAPYGLYRLFLMKFGAAIIALLSVFQTLDMSEARPALRGHDIAPVDKVGPIPIAVFGKDNRRKLPEHLNALKHSIGLVYNNRARSVCTGFCVAPNVIATASHCLFRTKGERQPLLRNFKFVLKAAQRKRESSIEGCLLYTSDAADD